MTLAKYPLRKNTLFKDKTHPKVIYTKDFAKHNLDVFANVALADLEKLMPDNPMWMHGARGCSAIAQTVCLKYGVQSIVPSNVNMVDGVVRYEFGE